MKSITMKSTVAAMATAATLLTSGGIMPMTQASAETILVPGIGGTIRPNVCLTNPALCHGGTVRPLHPTPMPMPTPTPAPAPTPSHSGMSAGTAAAIGLLGGVVAGAAIANANRPRPVVIQPQPTSAGNAHLNWCFGHYKSYRVADNSWQPYEGPRRQCRSPFI